MGATFSVVIVRLAIVWLVVVMSLMLYAIHVSIILIITV